VYESDLWCSLWLLLFRSCRQGSKTPVWSAGRALCGAHTSAERLFLQAPVPGFQDRLWSINIYSHHSQEKSGKESLCVRDWARGERESERPKGRSRGQAKALFVLILAHELVFTHTQPDSLHWIRLNRTRLLSRPPNAVFFSPATYCTHVKKPITWLKPPFSLKETLWDHYLKWLMKTLSSFCHLKLYDFVYHKGRCFLTGLSEQFNLKGSKLTLDPSDFQLCAKNPTFFKINVFIFLVLEWHKGE